MIAILTTSLLKNAPAPGDRHSKYIRVRVELTQRPVQGGLEHTVRLEAHHQRAAERHEDGIDSWASFWEAWKGVAYTTHDLVLLPVRGIFGDKL